MNTNLKIGLNCTLKEVVKEKDTALYLGSGDIEVLGTPAVIAYMENASKNCVDLHLPIDDTTVGIEINVKHLRAKKVGDKIIFSSTLTEINDRKLLFTVESFDELGKIAEGTHTRVIVNRKRFISKL